MSLADAFRAIGYSVGVDKNSKSSVTSSTNSMPKSEQAIIDQLGQAWWTAKNANNVSGMQAAHDAATAIRMKYLSGNQTIIHIDYATGSKQTLSSEATYTDRSLIAPDNVIATLATLGSNLLANAAKNALTRTAGRVVEREVANLAEEATPVAGQITGYTRHGLAQAMGRDGGRGVAPKAILDAVNNPTKIVEQTGGRVKYVGKDAVVVLNQDGKVVTTYAKSSVGIRGGR
jgi:hypothetical protein